jgi:hypothetical protein
MGKLPGSCERGGVQSAWAGAGVVVTVGAASSPQAAADMTAMAATRLIKRYRPRLAV